MTSSILTVVPLSFDRRPVTQFITFAWEIYKNDPHWVPPLIHDQRKLLNPQKNPFFKHSEVQLLGAFENGKMVGRLAVGINQNSNQFRHENVAFFGFFESFNEPQIAQALFQKAEEWAKSKGKEILRGPFNLTINDECGLLIDGFNSDPYIMMTHNPPYYAALLEHCGLQPAMDSYAYFMDMSQKALTEPLLQMSEYVEKTLKPTVRPVDKNNNFLKDVFTAMDMINESLAANWGASPMTKEEIEFKAADLKQAIIPELCFFIEVNQRPVGFSFTLPNYNEAIKKANGHLFPLGLLKILYTSRKIKTARGIQLGMIKEYQKTGLGAYCYVQMISRAAKIGIYSGEMSWILANNKRMVNAAELMGGRRYKTYRWYEKQIA